MVILTTPEDYEKRCIYSKRCGFRKANEYCAARTLDENVKQEDCFLWRLMKKNFPFEDW